MVNRNRRFSIPGFTLVEILVVIGIITVLASILFPVFNQVRGRARQTVCANNEKQIGLGFLQYAEDNDEALPAAYNMSLTFRAILEPYIKSGKDARSVWKCPSNNFPSHDFSGYPTNYVLNNTNAHFLIGARGLPLGAVGETSDKILMVELKYRVWSDYNSPGWGSAPKSVATLGNWGWAQVAHGGRWNCLFCDGHVKAMKPTQTITPVNHWTYSCDSPDPDTPVEPMLSAMHWLEVANP